MPDRMFDISIDKLSPAIKLREIGRSKGATSHGNDVA